MRELPKGWVWTMLGDVCRKPQYGWTTSATREPSEFKLLRTSDITAGKVNWGTVPYAAGLPPSAPDFEIQEGDIFISRAGSVGASALIETRPPRSLFASYLIRMRPVTNVVAPFLHYFLKSPQYWRDVRNYSLGIAVPNINASKLSQIQVPLAPLAEQHRIVAEIEKQFTRLDACIPQIMETARKLKALRSSLFSAAFAKAWPVVPLRDLASIKGGLTKDTNRHGKEQCSPVPYLRVANVQRGFLDLTTVREIMATPAEIAELKLQPGDVLFTEGGDRDKLGRGWVWNGEIEVCIHQNHVFRARLGGHVLPKWVSYYANSVGQRYFHREGKQTTNLASVNITKLGSLPIPVPALHEQRTIVNELEAQNTECEYLERELSQTLNYAARLRQAILAKAFSGQLVPQDPSDEPASILLERIRSQRTQHIPKARSPRTRKRGTVKAQLALQN